MDQNRLDLPAIVYICSKIAQGAYQFCYLLVLIGTYEEDAKLLSIVSFLILAFILSSYHFLHKKMEPFFNQNKRCSEYFIIIILDILIAIIALIGYPAAISHIKFEYGGNKEKLYYLHHSKDSGLKGNKLSRFSRYLSEETIEPIETTKYLVEQAVNLQSNVISFVGIKGNLSESTDLSINEYNVTMNSTSVQEPSDEMFEDFYYFYINIQLLIPSMVSLFTQVFVVGVIGWIEFVKYNIRKSHIQETHEINLMGNAAGSVD